MLSFMNRNSQIKIKLCWFCYLRSTNCMSLASRIPRESGLGCGDNTVTVPLSTSTLVLFKSTQKYNYKIELKVMYKNN